MNWICFAFNNWIILRFILSKLLHWITEKVNYNIFFWTKRMYVGILAMYLSSSTKYIVIYLGTSTSTSTFLKLKYKVQASTKSKMFLSTGKYKYRCTWPQPCGLAWHVDTLHYTKILSNDLGSWLSNVEDVECRNLVNSASWAWSSLNSL